MNTTHRLGAVMAATAALLVTAVGQESGASKSGVPSSDTVQKAPMTTDIPASLTTPNRVDMRLGALEFTDGVPSKATAEKVYDHLDFTYAYRAFMDNLRGVSVHAMRKGLLDFGASEQQHPIGR
jgi:hypothetical protein